MSLCVLCKLRDLCGWIRLLPVSKTGDNSNHRRNAACRPSSRNIAYPATPAQTRARAAGPPSQSGTARSEGPAPEMIDALENEK